MKSDIFIIEPAEKPIARLLLLHGAGAPVQSDYLTLLASELAKNGIEVWRVNFAYMQKSLSSTKQPPPPVVKLQQELADFIALVPDDLPLFIGGKSMGGRVATLFANQVVSHGAAAVAQLQARIKGICCFGYPFCPPAKKALGIAARTEHFSTLNRPVLIIQGERDEFGGKELESTLHCVNWPQLTIKWLPFGDHDLKTLKKHLVSQQELIRQAATASRDFIHAKLLAR